MNKLNIDEIEKIIPHRKPFLFLDEVLELTPGKKILAKKTITNNEFWIQGHFPNFPVCPGVILIEMLAQAGAVSILALPENKNKIALFGGINKARFKKQVVPGNVVFLAVEITKQIKEIGVGNAIATVDGDIAVTAEIIFALKKV